MLVLSRKQNEEILVGENVSIRILSVSGNRVRVGIVAPNAVEIRRAELDLRCDVTDEVACSLNSEAESCIDSSSQRCSSTSLKARAAR